MQKKDIKDHLSNLESIGVKTSAVYRAQTMGLEASKVPLEWARWDRECMG